jgi:hypothetical protein
MHCPKSLAYGSLPIDSSIPTRSIGTGPAPRAHPSSGTKGEEEHGAGVSSYTAAFDESFYAVEDIPQFAPSGGNGVSPTTCQPTEYGAWIEPAPHQTRSDMWFGHDLRPLSPTVFERRALLKEQVSVLFHPDKAIISDIRDYPDQCEEGGKL